MDLAALVDKCVIEHDEKFVSLGLFEKVRVSAEEYRTGLRKIPTRLSRDQIGHQLAACRRLMLERQELRMELARLLDELHDAADRDLQVIESKVEEEPQG